VPAKDMPKPPSAHVDWYRKAAEAENAEAQYILGELLLKGDGVGRDFRQAALLFRRAAERGNLARAQYALCLLHQRGIGVLKNDVEAVLWCQKAADQNYSAAITHVGIAMLEGRGIAKDEDAARKTLERAAELDEPNAQYTLGRIYERGLGIKKDPVVAMKWFILAAEQAHQQATQKVEELSTSLPRDLQERATELVSEHYRRFRRSRG
jgi:TPR repeat protein